MNKLLLICFTVALFIVSPKVQGQAYMDAIADETCGCLNEFMSSGETRNVEMRIGACLLKAAGPYEKQLKKDYGIELTNLSSQGEKLGEMLGVKIATRCPDSFMAMMELMEKGQEAKEVALEEKTYEGTVTGVNDQQFIVFTIKDASGKASSFYWLSFFTSDLGSGNNYKEVKGKKVQVGYREEEFFDPRINEYKKFNVITSLKSLN
ncbi:hypothetical protein [Pontibacter litorisediminis]|uniref:hypothetical protein n=1 Tax=Pontibacter litorisediminis TaxID=1846260 RepID=UPI0023EBD295|nr:hypothetical protein [Pontibacter litorisediminis]